MTVKNWLVWKIIALRITAIISKTPLLASKKERRIKTTKGFTRHIRTSGVWEHAVFRGDIEYQKYFTLQTKDGVDTKMKTTGLVQK